jgi:hypothetical protein
VIKRLGNFVEIDEPSEKGGINTGIINFDWVN